MKPQRMTMFGLLGAMAMLLTGCAQQYAEESYTLTGLYGPGFHYYDDGYGNWGWDGNFDIYVGIPFEWKAGAKCYDSSGIESDWWADISIYSGELPPGLELVPATGTIVGVPTRAGTWHLRVAFSNLSCAGTYYETRYQDLTIKTSGS